LTPTSPPFRPASLPMGLAARSLNKFLVSALVLLPYVGSPWRRGCFRLPLSPVLDVKKLVCGSAERGLDVRGSAGRTNTGSTY
jgi:hypothetical protein